MSKYFVVGDIISVGIPREDRTKTDDNKRLYCRIIAKPHPDRHQLLSKYGILIGLYPTKALQRASPMLEHEFLFTTWRVLSIKRKLP